MINQGRFLVSLLRKRFFTRPPAQQLQNTNHESHLRSIHTQHRQLQRDNKRAPEKRVQNPDKKKRNQASPS
jgi:hypothetical protein